MNDQNAPSTSPFQSIRTIDYTVIFVRDMAAMRRFYEDVLCFPLTRELSANWIEYQIGGNTLALSRPGRTAKDAPTPKGSASLQLAFKVAVDDVDRCAEELLRHGDYDLTLRCTEKAKAIRNIPAVLCERGKPDAANAKRDRLALERALKRRGIAGEVQPGLVAGAYRVKRSLTSQPLSHRASTPRSN